MVIYTQWKRMTTHSICMVYKNGILSICVYFIFVISFQSGYVSPYSAEQCSHTHTHSHTQMIYLSVCCCCCCSWTVFINYLTKSHLSTQHSCNERCLLSIHFFFSRVSECVFVCVRWSLSMQSFSYVAHANIKEAQHIMYSAWFVRRKGNAL